MDEAASASFGSISPSTSSLGHDNEGLNDDDDSLHRGRGRGEEEKQAVASPVEGQFQWAAKEKQHSSAFLPSRLPDKPVKLPQDISETEEATETETMKKDDDEEDITALEEEVDFYRNPTILSRLVLNQKYEPALRRIQKEPREVRVWVSSRRVPIWRKWNSKSSMKNYEGGSKGQQRVRPRPWTRSSTDMPSANAPNLSADTSTPVFQEKDGKYSVRQLPLHIACMNLQRTHDPFLKSKLQELICELIAEYPESCIKRDHEENLPLHVAIWYGASPEVISMFLMAYPSLMSSKDNQGRSLSDINMFRTGSRKKVIQDLFELGEAFWHQARKEIEHRLKLGSQSPESSVDSRGARSRSPKQQDALNSPIAAKTKEGATSGPVDEPIMNEMSWEQLEMRAIALEQLLCEVNEVNYNLTKQVEMESRRKWQLVDELRNNRSREAQSRDVEAVQQERNRLQEKLDKLEAILQSSVLDDDSTLSDMSAGDDDTSSIFRRVSEAQGSSSRDRESDLMQLNIKLKNRYDAMKEKHRGTLERLKRLRIMARTALKKTLSGMSLSGLSGGMLINSRRNIKADSSVSTRSHSHSWKSQDSPFTKSSDKQRQDRGEISLVGGKRATEIPLRETPIKASLHSLDNLSTVQRIVEDDDDNLEWERSDNLSTLFRAAASREAREFPGPSLNTGTERAKDIEIPALFIEYERSKTPIQFVGMKRAGLELEGDGMHLSAHSDLSPDLSVGDYASVDFNDDES